MTFFLRFPLLWTGAGVQDAAALVVAVGVNDFDVLCLHKVSSLGFYFSPAASRFPGRRGFGVVLLITLKP